MAAPVTANASENSRACQLGWVRLEYGVRRNRVSWNKNTASTPNASEAAAVDIAVQEGFAEANVL